MRLLGLMFFVLPFVSASPHPSAIQPSGSTCLAISLTLFFVLSLLVILQQAFRRRRSRIADNHLASPSQSSSEKLESSYQSKASSSSTFVSVSGFKDDPVYGIWVGMFGSPEWETRQRVRFSSYKESQTLQMSSLVELGRRRNSSFSRRSSALSRGSVVSVGSFGNTPVSSVVQSRVLYNLDGGNHLRSRSLKIPSTPSRAVLKTPRRFSAPVVSRMVGPSRMRRPSLKSMKSVRSYKASIDGSLHLSSTSVRLVDSASLAPDLPLHLALKARHASMSSSISQSPPLSGVSLDSSDNDEMTPVPPQQCSQPQSICEISRPYPLTPSTKLARKRNQALEEQSQFWQPSSPNHGKTRSPGISTSTLSSARYEGQVFVKTPVAPMPMPFNPLEITMPSPTFSPDFSSFVLPSGAPPMPSVLRGKPKARVPSRTRRSPVLGPSPLRSMILPEATESPQRGAGGPRGSESTHTYPSMENNKWSSVLSAKPVDDDAQPNSLVNLIQELVQETSEWDPSLFMDAKFKSLLEKSGLDEDGTRLSPGKFQQLAGVHDGDRNGSGTKESGSDSDYHSLGPDLSNTGGSSDSSHSGSGTGSGSASEEIVLEMLGIELQRNSPGGSRSTLESGKSKSLDAPSPSHNATELVSFWDDSSWDRVKQRDSAESVGLAV